MPEDLSPLWRNIAVVAAGALAVVVVILILARLVRRRNAADEAGVFTLQDLRQMRADGQISEAEYERLRAAVLGGAGVGPVRPAGAEADAGGADAYHPGGPGADAGSGDGADAGGNGRD